MSKEATPESAEDGSVDAETENEEAQKKKGMGLIPMAIAGIVAAGAAGGAAFMLTPAGEDKPVCVAEDPAAPGEEHDAASADQENTEDCIPAEAKDEHDGKDKKKKDKVKKGGKDSHGGGESSVKPLGAVQHSEHATFLVLEPMVVSIAPVGRSKHLKISLVFETTDDGAEILLENGFYVQDVLNTYLRSIDASVLEDPASMSRLRAQILRRVRTIAPDAEITNVLFTEFILT